MPIKNQKKKGSRSNRGQKSSTAHPTGYLSGGKHTVTGGGLLRTVRLNSMADFVASTTLETVRNVKFKLSDLLGVTEFTSLFDQYRIKRATLMVTPRISETIDSNVVSNPVMYSCADFDGSSVSSIAGMLEYATCQIHDARRSFELVVESPRLALAAYQGAFTAYASSTGWIDCSYPDVEHYGAVIGLPAQSTTTRWYIHVKLDLEFRHVR